MDDRTVVPVSSTIKSDTKSIQDIEHHVLHRKPNISKTRDQYVCQQKQEVCY